MGAGNGGEQDPAPPPPGPQTSDVFLEVSEGFTDTRRAFHFYLNDPQVDLFTLKLC